MLLTSGTVNPGILVTGKVIPPGIVILPGILIALTLRYQKPGRSSSPRATGSPLNSSIRGRILSPTVTAPSSGADTG